VEAGPGSSMTAQNPLISEPDRCNVGAWVARIDKLRSIDPHSGPAEKSNACH